MNKNVLLLRNNSWYWMTNMEIPGSSQRHEKLFSTSKNTKPFRRKYHKKSSPLTEHQNDSNKYCEKNNFYSNNHWLIGHLNKCDWIDIKKFSRMKKFRGNEIMMQFIHKERCSVKQIWNITRWMRNCNHFVVFWLVQRKHTFCSRFCKVKALTLKQN